MSKPQTQPAIADLDAEDNVLAYMLLNDAAYKVCVRKLCLADFFDDANRAVFRILADCCGHDLDEPARLTRCWHDLRRSMKTREASVKLGSLMAGVMNFARHAPALQFWLRKLLECSQRRAVVLLAQDVAEAAQSASAGFLDVLRAHYQRIMDRATSTESARLVGDTVYTTLEELEAAKENPARLSSGIDVLDDSHGGIARGECIVIGGTTGTGKSALALSMAVHAAQRGRSVAFFSLEMTAAQLQQRILAQLAGVNLGSIVRSSYTKDERRRMVEASATMGTWKFAIYDRGDVKVGDIHAQSLTHKADHGLDLLVVDYCQLVRPDNPRASLYEGLTSVSRGLKVLSKDLSVPVLSLAQLNRESIKSGDPRVEHLKGSGSIGEDADMVMLLSERDPDPEEKLTGAERPIRLRVDKARQGERIVWHLVFDAAHQTFKRQPVVEWSF